jgi:glycosyltransferase involved in cell wall biosynthesis
MKILVCTQEFPPDGAGIAYMVQAVTKHISCGMDEITICSPSGPDIVVGKRSYIHHFGVFGLLHYWVQVYRYIRKNGENFELFWYHNPFFLFFPKNLPSLVTFHSTYRGEYLNQVWSGNLSRFYKLLAQWIEAWCIHGIPRDSRITCVGPALAEEIQAIRGVAGDVLVIPNGVDVSVFYPAIPDKGVFRERLGIPDGSPVVLFLGRLTSQKDPCSLLPVFRCLQKQDPPVSLIIGGRGELSGHLQQEVVELGLSRVHIIGYVDDADLPSLYRTADFFIMPSRYEGGSPPLSLAQALASGLPAIVPDIPCFDFITKAACGIQVSFSDVAGAARKIGTFIAGFRGLPEGKREIRQAKNEYTLSALNARRYAVEILDWKRIADLYQGFMEPPCVPIERSARDQGAVDENKR